MSSLVFGVPAVDNVPPLITLPLRAVAPRRWPGKEEKWLVPPNGALVGSLPSSLYLSHNVYREIISWTIVATSDMLTFKPAINSTISGVFCRFGLLAVERDDRRVGAVLVELLWLED